MNLFNNKKKIISSYLKENMRKQYKRNQVLSKLWTDNNILYIELNIE